MKNIAKWLYFLGLLLAIIVAFVAALQAPWMLLILLLIAIFVGIFFFDSSDVVNLGIRFLVLVAVQGAFGAIPAIGGFLTTLFGGVVAFLAPVVLTVLVVWFFRHYFFSGEHA